MQLRHFLATSILVILGACSTADKFPYPPQFVTLEAVGPNALPAPPAVGSPVFEKEIDGILLRQSKLTDAQKKVIFDEAHVVPEMMVAPVLGHQYTQQNYPALYTLLKHAASDAWRISDATEDYWQSPRPWVADKRVQLLVPAITRPGYPSGHTTTNTVWAHILGELFPQKQAALFARAMEIGGHRIDGGVHFPHDVKGGRAMGDIIFAKMQQNPEFQRELAAAKAELATH